MQPLRLALAFGLGLAAALGTPVLAGEIKRIKTDFIEIEIEDQGSPVHGRNVDGANKNWAKRRYERHPDESINPEYVARLQWRVRRLEQAVLQLQDQLAERPATAAVEYACYIKDMSTTHLGKASTETEARAIALQKCGGKAWCDDDEVKCSSAPSH